MEFFSPIDKLRRSERVARAIRRSILEGRLQPGERLPPERTLAKRFEVTRNTVREAMRHLERMRLVSIRHGSGAIVQDYLSTTGFEFLAALLRSTRDTALMKDIMEARAVLGQAICGHAIDTAKPEALAEFYGCVEAFAAEAERTNPDPATLQQLDLQLQSSLIRAGGNRAFILLYNSLCHIYERIAHLFEFLVAEPRTLSTHYREAARALAAGDRAEAKEALAAVYAMGLSTAGTNNKEERDG
jgi:GntR family transcriptional repressor for pyruvate dehydrogenase complex